MPYLTWLADALRQGGCKVIEQPGWKTRGHGAMSDVRGVLAHHTAGGGSSDWLTVQNGRPGLEGPLAHMTLERDGTFRVIAAGQCWHAGTGAWPGIPTNAGNAHLIGIEGVSRGVNNDWTPEQRAAYPKGIAALLRYAGVGSDRCILHREWATPKGRKSDPQGFDGPALRSQVQSILAGGAPSTPASDRIETSRRRRDGMIDNNIIPQGAGRFTLNCPIGGGAFTEDAYLCVSVLEGTGSVRVDVQDSGAKGLGTIWFTEQELQVTSQNGSPCPSKHIPQGAKVLRVFYDFNKAPVGGTITLETRPRA